MDDDDDNSSSVPEVVLSSSTSTNQPNNFQIPVDYFITKRKNNNLGSDGNRSLQFVDASGNLLFGVDKLKGVPPDRRRRLLLVDASRNVLIALYRDHNGSWQGFSRDANGAEDILFRVERTLNTFNTTEFGVFLVDKDVKESAPDFKIRGRAFYRSCTIYKGNSVVAQTSLMYKLGTWSAYVPRSRFRLTIFPGFQHALVVALITIFFDGRKIWI